MSDIFIPGISERISRSEISTIKIEDLLEMTFSPGYILFLPAGGKPINLIGAGQLIDVEKLKKYQERGMKSLFIYQILNEDVVNIGRNLIKDFKKSVYEEDYYANRCEILKWVKSQMWHEGDASFLDISIIFQEGFCELDEVILEKVQDCSIILYERSLKVAAMGVIVGLTMGYTDVDFLKDLYHSCFLLDYGLVAETVIPYKVFKALEEERMRPGSGLLALQAMKASVNEMYMFLGHPKIGYEKAVRELTHMFNYPDVLRCVLRHHENALGKGFPYSLKHEDLSEWETIPMIVDHIIPYDDRRFKRGDISGFLKRELLRIEDEGALEYLPCRRIFFKMIKEFNSKFIFKRFTEVVEEGKCISIETIFDSRIDEKGVAAAKALKVK